MNDFKRKEKKYVIFTMSSSKKKEEKKGKIKINKWDVPARIRTRFFGEGAQHLNHLTISEQIPNKGYKPDVLLMETQQCCGAMSQY